MAAARAGTRGCGPARRGRSRRGARRAGRRARASTRPHGSTISERPWLVRRPGVSPHCAGASTKHWFSIARARSSTSQWSRPVSRAKAARHAEEARAARRERAVELGEAHVVADRETDDARRCLEGRQLRRPARRAPTRGRPAPPCAESRRRRGGSCGTPPRSRRRGEISDAGVVDARRRPAIASGKLPPTSQIRCSRRPARAARRRSRRRVPGRRRIGASLRGAGSAKFSGSATQLGAPRRPPRDTDFRAAARFAAEVVGRSSSARRRRAWREGISRRLAAERDGSTPVRRITS